MSPRSPILGAVEWFERGERRRVERVASELRTLGIEHLRTGVSWAEWHSPGGAEWYGWLLPRLARDFELLPCVHYTPPSLAVVPSHTAPPRRLRDYADFLDVLVTEHGRCFEEVELWNEPNNLNDWDWRLDPQWTSFAEMIGDAAHWMKRRGKITVLGGMSPTDANWLRHIASLGGLRWIDVVGVHGFPGGWTTVWEGWEAELDAVRGALDEAGADCDVWITEAGFSTWRNDEFAQLRAFVEALAAPTGRVYWYAAEDLDPSRSACDGFHVDPRHYHFGLVHTDGEPKLLARALAEGDAAQARLLVGVDDGKPRRRRGRYALITGGAGFIGTNLADRLLEDGHRVVVYDSLARPGVERNLLWLKARHGDRVHARVADVRDAVALREVVEGADAVFHLGAQVAVTTSLVRPLQDFAVNLEGTVTLLEALRQVDRPVPLLFTSTNKVYGTLPDLELANVGDRWEPVDPVLRAVGIDERRPLDFCTPYGCSKGGADAYVLDFAKSYGLPAIVFRMSCVYGPHQYGNEDQGWVAHFVLRALAGEPLTVYGDGAQVRDILFATDLVDAMLRVYGDAERLAGAAFNVGGGPGTTISLLELIGLIEELHGTRPEVEFAAERAGDQRWYVSDTSRLRKATGWRPRVGVDEGVTRLYEWLTERDAREASAGQRARA
jgi:CDP-paratose 2-epimerase